MLYKVEPINRSPYMKNDYYNALDWSNCQNNTHKDTDTKKSFLDIFNEAISKCTSNSNRNYSSNTYHKD